MQYLIKSFISLRIFLPLVYLYLNFYSISSLPGQCSWTKLEQFENPMLANLRTALNMLRSQNQSKLIELNPMESRTFEEGIIWDSNQQDAWPLNNIIIIIINSSLPLPHSTP